MIVAWYMCTQSEMSCPGTHWKQRSQKCQLTLKAYYVTRWAKGQYFAGAMMSQISVLKEYWWSIISLSAKIIKLYPHHVLSSWRMSWRLQSSNKWRQMEVHEARKHPFGMSLPNCLYKPFYLRGCWHPQQCPLHSSGPWNTTKTKNLTHLFAVAVFGIKIPAVFGRIWVHIPEKWDVLMFHKAGVIATSKQFRSQNCCTLLT